MNSNDLTREQLNDLVEKARRLTALLHSTESWMEQTDFPVTDRLFQQTNAALKWSTSYE